MCNCTTFGDLDLPINGSWRFVSDSCLSCYTVFNVATCPSVRPSVYPSVSRWDICRCLLWNVSRISWLLISQTSISLTLNDPEPRFQGHGILTSWGSWLSYMWWIKLLKNATWQPYTVYRMEPLSVTFSDLWYRFQGHKVICNWISEKTTRDRAAVTMERQYEVVCATMNGCLSKVIDEPLTLFSQSCRFCSWRSRKLIILGIMLLKKHSHGKAYKIYQMVELYMTFFTSEHELKFATLFDVECTWK